MITWILIMWIWTTGEQGTSSMQHIKFANKAACENAVKAVKKDHIFAGPSLHLVCVPGVVP